MPGIHYGHHDIITLTARPDRQTGYSEYGDGLHLFNYIDGSTTAAGAGRYHRNILEKQDFAGVWGG